MRVLLAEDSRVMRKIIIRTLRQAGWYDWQIEQAEDGAQALAMVLEREPDLVISVLGLYVGDRDRMTAVLTLDLALAAYLGGSLALMPPRAAEAAIADGELSPDLLENVGEVLNVLAVVVNAHSDTHQRLYQTC